ncbi:MAG: DegT/DnrJ/EryC1/StrS family aminotransferase [Coprothermobacterota bacterium]|nr:DegT/DnrJ/EryC1/StrS family aminotransferase [Coprothermobacterota bacterium]
MIPRYEPPFSFLDLLKSTLRSPDIDILEHVFQDRLQVPHAVLVPSGRAGICWALKAAACPGGTVVTPAYTSPVVHEAILEAGASMRLLDCQPGSFLVAEEQYASLSTEACAVILCELFGHTFDLPRVRRSLPSSVELCIVDMTMTVPTPHLMERLADRDVAIVSFGIGKSMYAGWGGMLLTKNGAIAEELRKQRSIAEMKQGKRVFFLNGKIFLIAAIQSNRVLYSLATRSFEAFQAIRGKKESSGMEDPSAVRSAEWWQSPPSLNRALIMCNIAKAETYHLLRRRNERLFREAFSGLRGVTLPPPSDGALSHFSILVSPSLRSPAQRALKRQGVGTWDHYPFPDCLDPALFPESFQTSQRILNLPIGNKVTTGQVKWIADRVRAFFAPAHGKAPE